MTPDEIARSYDLLAEQWASEQFPRANGIAQHERAVAFVGKRGRAIDIGCGSSGRFIDLLQAHGFEVEGLDLSERMLFLARQRHPAVVFHRADICDWPLPHSYDLISAWDSIWHVPLEKQLPVLRKLLDALAPAGVCIFTTGGVPAPEEKHDAAMGPPMYHAAAGIPATLSLIAEAGCVCRHLEYDQHPELHLYIIAQRLP